MQRSANDGLSLAEMIFHALKDPFDFNTRHVMIEGRELSSRPSITTYPVIKSKGREFYAFYYHIFGVKIERTRILDLISSYILC